MTLSPEKAASDAQWISRTQNLGLAPVPTGFYVTYADDFDPAANDSAVKPSWVCKKNGATLFFCRTGKVHNKFRLEVAVERSALVHVEKGPTFVALPGPCKFRGNRRWSHHQNTFTAISSFVSASQVSVEALPTLSFSSPIQAAQTFFSVLSCDHVVVYKIKAHNDAYVAVGQERNFGYSVLGNKSAFDTLASAETWLRARLHLDTLAITIPFLGEPSFGKLDLPPKLDLTTSKERKKTTAPMLIKFDQRRNQWYKHVIESCETKTVVNDAIVSFTVTVESQFVTGSSKVTAFLREIEDYDYSSKKLFKKSPVKALHCRVTEDKGVIIHLCFPYKLAVNLHDSRTWPFLTCTMMIDNGNGDDVAIRLFIGRFWHTDLKEGQHFRTKPSSVKFALIPAVDAEELTSKRGCEIARILPEDLSWLSDGKSADKVNKWKTYCTERLLSLVRYEDLKVDINPGKIVSILRPGETAIALSLLRSLTTDAAVRFNSGFVTRKYPLASVTNFVPR